MARLDAAVLNAAFQVLEIVLGEGRKGGGENLA